MEPGTGTQYHEFANGPCGCEPGFDLDDPSAPCGNERRHNTPTTFNLYGKEWKVGHDYLDTEIGDVCTLTYVVGKSSFCDTKPASEQPPLLVFEYERYQKHEEIIVDPNTRKFDPERFIERYEPPLPAGAPCPPW